MFGITRKEADIKSLEQTVSNLQAQVSDLQAVVDAAEHLVSKYRDELLHRSDVDALERALEQTVEVE